MKAMKNFCVALLLSVMPVMAAANGAAVRLDKAPVNLRDTASLQRGVKLFTSRCLACHGAAYMRYNRLRDIGMTEEQVKKDLGLPEDVKIGSTMQAAMDTNTAKLAYGVAPPDLSVISRSRSADWLYTYLRGFHTDKKRASGWNNTVFPDVGMPHVLADLQGEQELKIESQGGHETRKLVLVNPGTLKPAEYDAAVADLTNFLVYMGEPAKMVRYKLGMIVLGFLFALFVLIFMLKKEVWKDVH
jgi:ubiquinol-cytochrome c reductase cytochrome c1 subunit